MSRLTVTLAAYFVLRAILDATQGGHPLPSIVHRGLSESLAGRFELIYAPHWSFPEMQQAFGWSCDQFIYFGVSI